MEEQEIFNDTKGIVIIRNILSEEEQLKLIDIVNKKGDLTNTNGSWNFFGMRGRHFCNLNNYPQDDEHFIKDLTGKFKMCVESVDPSLTFLPVTHLLTLLYPDTKGLGWHQDGYGGNDGDEGAPVYSLTLGNSCIFEWRLVGNKQTNRCILKSGDIIVFGGEQRLMYHRVKSILKSTFNKIDNFDARINLTFRTCSTLTKEEEISYNTENYTKRLKEKWAQEKNNFFTSQEK